MDGIILEGNTNNPNQEMKLKIELIKGTMDRENWLLSYR